MASGTTIRSVVPHVLMADLAEPFAYSQAWYRRRGAMLVEITTADGITGWGEAFGPPEGPGLSITIDRAALDRFRA